MIRKNVLILAALVLISGVFSCSPKKEADHEHAEDVEEWAEMDEFHMIMAESFHPFMDSGNTEPARQNAAAMEELAARWAQSSLPGKVDNGEMKGKLSALKTSTANFRALVDRNDSTALGDSLTRLHDLYHSIQESWYRAGEHHH